MNNMKRDTVINIRVPTEMKALIERDAAKLAKESGLKVTVASYVYRLIQKHFKVWK